MTTLTLVSRSYCHLCQEMHQALIPMAAEFGVGIDLVDVDADSELAALYDEMVPVLLHDGAELCHYFLEVAKVRDYLGKIR